MRFISKLSTYIWRSASSHIFSAALLLRLIEVNLRYAHSNFVRKLLGRNYIDAALFLVKSEFPNTSNQMGAVTSVLERNLEIAIFRLIVNNGRRN